MPALVQVSRDHEVVVLHVDHPPVNALSPIVRDAIAEALADSLAAPDIHAIVLIGAGRTFPAGGDIRHFHAVLAGRESRGGGLLPLTRLIEHSEKPIVAALHGTAFGGGLELAMAAHARIATPDAQVGQPEVKLGLIPGGGGTQRLPRLAGIAQALVMCMEGAPVNAPEALALGLIDRLTTTGHTLQRDAVALARERISQPLSRTCDRCDKLGTLEVNLPLFAAARDKARTKSRNLTAPLVALEAIEAAASLPFDEGCDVEQRLFEECLFSDQATALIHLFLAEREVVKVPGLRREANAAAIARVGIVGAGVMGGGIAMACANAGIPVVIHDADAGALARGRETIRKNYEASVQRQRFTQTYVDERLALIDTAPRLDAFADVDLVIEAVVERMAVKQQVFAALDRVCQPGAMLATNTSTLDIDAIAAATTRPASVLGLHFFSPANVMRLLEIVRGAATSSAVLGSALDFARRLGKIGVVVGNGFGFVGNRLFQPYRREAQFMAEEGVEIARIDRVLYDFGMAMGPLSTADLAGLDIGWRIRQEHRHLVKPGVRQPIAEDRLCEIGRFGQKVKQGWYRYDDQRQRQPDPDVAVMVREWAAAAGIAPREMDDREIRDRCIYALVNEAARVLAEGLAVRASDIDVIYVNGYGFPAYRGGPLGYADRVGVPHVLARIREFHAQLGDQWTPAPLLAQLAASGGSFASYDEAATTSGE